MFNGNYIYYFNNTDWVIFTDEVFFAGNIYDCSIYNINLVNETAIFSFDSILYEIEFNEEYTDGVDHIQFQSNISNEYTVIYLFEFYIIGYMDSKIVFDFTNILDPLPLLYYDYTYLLFNIEGFIEIWNYDDYLYHLPSKRRSLTNWSNISNKKNVFNGLSSINDNDKNIVVIRFYSENISVIELKMFGYCFLQNAIYYGPLSTNLIEINNIYGIESSLIQNAFAETMSLNFFYIDNINKRFYFNVDFIDSNKNYLSFFFKLFIKESLHKRTFINFHSNREPALISKAYLTLSHWSEFGYYNQTIPLSDYTENTRIQLLSTNNTWSTFEMIYFNISDISDNLFTGNNIFGYISQFIVEYNILPSILITSLLVVLPPILIIVIPTLALSKSITKLIIPLFILMSIISFTVSLIPLWLLFIIITNLGMYIIMEEEF